jgi:hypothetical protein
VKIGGPSALMKVPVKNKAPMEVIKIQEISIGDDKGKS